MKKRDEKRIEETIDDIITQERVKDNRYEIAEPLTIQTASLRHTDATVGMRNSQGHIDGLFASKTEEKCGSMAARSYQI